jgi:hypothetical protein
VYENENKSQDRKETRRKEFEGEGKVEKKKKP